MRALTVPTGVRLITREQKGNHHLAGRWIMQIETLRTPGFSVTAQAVVRYRLLLAFGPYLHWTSEHASIDDARRAANMFGADWQRRCRDAEQQDAAERAQERALRPASMPLAIPMLIE